jgi:hypothetical protein
LAPMHLDCNFADADVASDLLVEAAFHNLLHHFALARGKRLEALV